MDCPKCGSPCPSSERHCPTCQADVGFPNVRAADTTEERTGLLRRLQHAQVSANAGGYARVLADFGVAVSRSKAVFCQRIGVVAALVASDNSLYSTFYQQVRGESRLPEDNPWDPRRGAVDATLFPHYHEHITFAALSLDRVGPRKYGPCSVVLRDEMIRMRASVFEENSVVFFRKHRIVAGNPVPPGYRAVWAERSRLAMAKLYSMLDANTHPEDFPAVLLTQAVGAEEEDFVEVHIFGPIHRRAVECVVGSRPKRREDRVLWRSLNRKLAEVGATLEEL